MISDLGAIYFEVNNLFGPIPASTGTLEQLTEILLHDNMLSGNMSSIKWENLKALGEFTIPYNNNRVSSR